MLTNDGSNTYQWDARDRLVSISGPALTASFKYDALGRRTSKTINGQTTTFVYDGDDIVQEMGDSATSASYLRSLSIDEPFIRQGDTDEFYHVDALGSSVALSNSAGIITTSYGYEPFGKTTETGTSMNVLQYTGRENDGTGLYYYRARYYSPLLHRFLGDDPILSPLTPLTSWLCTINHTLWLLPTTVSNPSPRVPLDLHPVAYVGNNPLLRTDGLGLKGKERDKCARAEALACASALAERGGDVYEKIGVNDCIDETLGLGTYQGKGAGGTSTTQKYNIPEPSADISTFMSRCFQGKGINPPSNLPESCKPKSVSAKCQ